MKNHINILFVFSLNMVICFSYAQDTKPMNDTNTLQELVQDYKLWSVTEKPYKIKKIEHLYAHTDDLLAFDLMSPEKTVIKGWENYKAIWEPAMQNFNTWTITQVSDVEITVDENMALTTLIFAGEGQLNDKTPVNGEFHSTLIWKKMNNGWKIIHEHVSGPVKR